MPLPKYSPNLFIYLLRFFSFHYKFTLSNLKKYEFTIIIKQRKNKSNKAKKVKIERKDLVISRECGKTPSDEIMKNKQEKSITHIKLKI